MSLRTPVAIQSFATLDSRVDDLETNVTVVQEAPLNVKYSEYDAQGDGSTDDTAAFNSALADVNGGKLYIPRGVYRVGDVAVPDEGVTIMGDGFSLPGTGQGTVLKAKTSATYALKVQGKRGVAIRDLLIDGNERASRGLLYEATASAGSQQLLLDHVAIFRCTRGLHIGPGDGGINQADKNTLINPWIVECDYGIYNEAVNSQETVLINANIGTSYQAGVYMTAGCLSMLGGQFQGAVASGKGIQFAGANIHWVNLRDVIFEGPDHDIYDDGSRWPKDGVIAEHVTFQGPTWNVNMNTIGARMSARHCRFNADFDPLTLGGGIVTSSQTGCYLTTEHCTHGAPLVVGGNPPFWRKEIPLRTDVASAATISPAPGASVVVVTGATTITSITAQPQGAEIELLFTDTAQLSDGGNLVLNGNLTGGANRMIRLRYVNAWYEVSRSVN